MRKDGWCARYGDAGKVGGSWWGSGAAIFAGAEVVCWFWVVVDGKSGREWSEGDVVEVGVGAAGAKATGGIRLVRLVRFRCWLLFEATHLHDGNNDRRSRAVKQR